MKQLKTTRVFTTTLSRDNQLLHLSCLYCKFIFLSSFASQNETKEVKNAENCNVKIQQSKERLAYNQVIRNGFGFISLQISLVSNCLK